MDSTQNATNGGSTGGDSSSATYKSQEASAAIASHSRPVDKIYAVEEDTAALTEARCALFQAMNTTMELPSLFYRGEAAAAAAVAGSSLQPDVFFEGIIASHDDGLNSLHDQQHHPYNGDTAHLTSGAMAAIRPLLSTIDPPHDDDDDGGGGGADVGATPTSTAMNVLQELDANKIIIDSEIQRIQKCGAFYSLFGFDYLVLQI